VEYRKRTIDERRAKSNAVSAANTPIVRNKAKTGTLSKNEMRVFISISACWIGFVGDFIAVWPVIVVPYLKGTNGR